MKTAIFSILIASGVTAFAPTTRVERHAVATAAVADLDTMFGVDIETGKKIFDPVGLAEWAPGDFLRKAELSNGRSAMLANVGWFWPKLVGTFDSDDVTTTDPIEAILQADPQWWAQFVIFCGTIEAIKYRAELEGKSYTGEGPAAIDWAKQWDKLTDAQKSDMRLKELKNGRLAMLGFASYVADYFIEGSVPLL